MNNYQKAVKKVECAQENMNFSGCCCGGGTIGPTGPTDPVKSEKLPNFISHYTNGLNL